MKNLYLLSFLLLAGTNMFAQATEGEKPYYHSHSKKGSATGENARATGNSGTGANIDVVYHRFNWNINPDVAKNISGTVTTYFKTIESNVKTISFDLNQASFYNAALSASYHGSTTGVSCSFPASGNPDILKITLPVTLATAGTVDSITITYSGVPPDINSQAEGFQRKGSAGNYYIYTLSESYEDKDWWPCKADMQDKVDSTDFFITTPSAYTAVANGVLAGTVTSGSNKIYHYKHRYPIASYLVAIAVAKYTVYNRGTVNIGGTNMPVEYHILTSRTSPSVALTAMDNCKLELAAFSAKFGDYPFKKEKYGMYEFWWNGGMEHQTNSAMSYGSMQSWGTIAHELGHQWFGDKVTFSTWNHLWLAEGFARYMEALAAELVPSLGQSAASERGDFKSAANGTVLRSYGCVVPDAKITNSNALWTSEYGSTVYERGAMVVSMLRTLLGDTKFFQACRNFLSDPALAYGSATTGDLQAHMEALAGISLTGFFNSFVKGSGYPTTTVNWWNPNGNVLNIALGTQARTAAGTTTYYKNVIPIRVQGSAGQDTMIVIYDEDGNNLAKAGNGVGALVSGNFLSFNLGFKPTTVTFDPYNMSLSTGSTVKTVTLDLRVLDFNVRQNGAANEAVLTLDGNAANTPVTLERSADGTSFTAIGTMEGQVAANTDKKYFFKDATPLSGNNYYRAKFKNASEEYVYTRVVKIGGETLKSFALTTNPVRGDIQLKNAAGSLNRDFRFSIYDAAGKLINHAQKKVQGNTTQLKTSGLPHGVYLLEIRSADNELQTIRFITD